MSRGLVGLAASTLLFGPGLASALLMSDVSSGKVLGDTSYATVTVTSAGNKTLKITATPQAYDGSSWSYQVCWQRAKNAIGSLRVSDRSKTSTVVYSVPSAAQSDCGVFTASPSTTYRVEFYAKSNFTGTLLVRRNFKTIAGTYLDILPQYQLFGDKPMSQDYLGTTNALQFLNSFGDTTTAGGSVNSNQGGLSRTALANLEKASTWVGSGLSPARTGSAHVLQMAYKTDDTHCYLKNLDGLFQLPTTNCSGLPLFPNGPSDDAQSATINYSAAQAACAFWDASPPNGQQPGWLSVACGPYPGSTFTNEAFCIANPTNSSCVGRPAPSAMQLLSAFGDTTLAAGSVNSNQGGSARTALANLENNSTYIGAGLNPSRTGSAHLLQMAYKTDDTHCYLKNLDGLFQLKTTNCTGLPTYPNGPSDEAQSATINYSAAHAACAFWDASPPNGQQPGWLSVACGPYPGSTLNGPQFCLLNPTNDSCKGTPGLSSLSAVQILNSFGDTTTAGGSVNSNQGGLSRTALANLEKASTWVGSGLSPARTGSAHVLQMAYKTDDTHCYLKNLDGLFQLPTTNCSGLPLFPNGPSDDAQSATINYSAAQAACAFWDASPPNGQQPGWLSVACGPYPGSTQTSASFCATYPTDDSCKINVPPVTPGNPVVTTGVYLTLPAGVSLKVGQSTSFGSSLSVNSGNISIGNNSVTILLASSNPSVAEIPSSETIVNSTTSWPQPQLTCKSAGTAVITAMVNPANNPFQSGYVPAAVSQTVICTN